ALGEDPMEQGLQVARVAGDDAGVARLVSQAIVKHRMIELEYYKENEDELSLRTVEPYALTNGREGWYVASFDPERDGVRHFRLDRIKRATTSARRFKPRPEVDPAAEVDGWLRTGEVEASRSARVWVSTERARWAREARRVVQEYDDGAVVVELSFAGTDWLVREILKEAGDAAVLAPEDAREAVRAAVARVREAHATPAQVEAGESYAELRGIALECDVVISRDLATVTALGEQIMLRHSVPRGVQPPPQLPGEGRAAIAQQAAKRVGLEFIERHRATWDHRSLGGVY